MDWIDRNDSVPSDILYPFYCRKDRVQKKAYARIQVSENSLIDFKARPFSYSLISPKAKNIPFESSTLSLVPTGHSGSLAFFR